MPRYIAFNNTIAEQSREAVEAANVNEACKLMGFADVDYQKDGTAVAWLNGDPHAVMLDED